MPQDVRLPAAPTAAITLWGRRNSSNVRKVLWCAEEAGVAYTSIEVGGAFGGNDTPAYRALNPNGVVPTLQDGALVLWESNAIVRYLAAQYAPALYPHSPPERALGDRWMDWTTSTFAGVFRDLFWGVLRTPEHERDHVLPLRWRSQANCSRAPMRHWRSSHICPASNLRWAIFRWAALSTRGSKCRSSAPNCRICVRGTNACAHGRRTSVR
ncbi:hypothetical protein ABZP12_00439 [Xanthomonas euvesicatoria]